MKFTFASYSGAHCVCQILGAPYDCFKFHSTANHRSGSCSLWDTNNTMHTKITLKEVAVIKVSMFSKVERGQGKWAMTIAEYRFKLRFCYLPFFQTTLCTALSYHSPPLGLAINTFTLVKISIWPCRLPPSLSTQLWAVLIGCVLTNHTSFILSVEGPRVERVSGKGTQPSAGDRELSPARCRRRKRDKSWTRSCHVDCWSSCGWSWVSSCQAPLHSGDAQSCMVTLYSV